MRKLLISGIGVMLCMLLFVGWADITVHATGDITYQQANIVVVNTSATTGLAIEGSVFAMYAAEDIKDNVGNLLMKEGTLIQQAVSTKDGAVFSMVLPVGKVVIKQSSVPQGYILSTESDIYFDITLGRTDYVAYLPSPVDTGVFNFTAITSSNAVAGGSFTVSIDALGNASGTVINNLCVVNDLPYNTRLDYITTGTFNEKEWPVTVYYKTNINSDWRLLGTATCGTAKTMRASDVSLKKGEFITSVYFYYGNVPVGFTSITSPKIYATIGDMTLEEQEVRNRAAMSGYFNGVKVIAPWYTTTIVKSPQNYLTDKLTAVENEGVYEVVVIEGENFDTESEQVITAAGNKEETVKPQTGDATPIGGYVALVVCCSLSLVGIVIYKVIKNKKKKSVVLQ